VEDLGIEDLKQLVNFYKQKASDLEFQLLQTQLKLNTVILNKKITEVSEQPKPDKKSK
jgi:hypothetical protein